jgi:hypothetical protein
LWRFFWAFDKVADLDDTDEADDELLSVFDGGWLR